VAALDELVEQGSAVLAATHDERFAQDATDRRIELAAGWIVGELGPRDGRAEYGIVVAGQGELETS
jgi:ABC-type ATPase involved in cell division